MDEETTTAASAPLDRADVRAALDPHASPVLLATLAEDVPALRPLIATNPACPAHVLAWLKERGEASIDDGLARNPHARTLGLANNRAGSTSALVHYDTGSHCPACGASVSADAWVCGSCFEPFGVRTAAAAPIAAADHTDAVATVAPAMPERPRHGPRVWPLVLLAVIVLAATGWLVVRKRNTATVVAALTTTSAAPTTTAAPATTTAVALTTTLAPAPTTTAPPPTTTAPPATTTAAPATTTAPTTAAPPATTAAPPATTVTPATAAPPEQQAVAIAQRLVDAYANADWPTVHALNPSDTRTDDGLAASYGNLDRAFALATQTTPAGPSVYNLRLGLVYQLTDNGVARTRLYCVHWDVDVGAAHIVRVSGVQLDERDGTIDPQSVRPELQATCPGLNLS
jgi:hypothetical protein